MQIGMFENVVREGVGWEDVGGLFAVVVPVCSWVFCNLATRARARVKGPLPLLM